jgi:hypothetical protein
MSRPFTTIGGVIFLIVAAVHAWRLAAGWSVDIDGHAVPMAASWAAVAVAAVLGTMLLVEARR